jgi:hypothetical protein
LVIASRAGSVPADRRRRAPRGRTAARGRPGFAFHNLTVERASRCVWTRRLSHPPCGIRRARISAFLSRVSSLDDVAAHDHEAARARAASDEQNSIDGCRRANPVRVGAIREVQILFASEPAQEIGMNENLSQINSCFRAEHFGFVVAFDGAIRPGQSSFARELSRTSPPARRLQRTFSRTAVLD